MYDLFKNLIGYTGQNQMYSWETYLLYGTISLAIVLTVWFLDLVVKVIRSFVRK